MEGLLATFLFREHNNMTLTKRNPSIGDMVRLASEWLDTNFPGWHGSVDCDTIDICSYETCIFGQLCKAGVDLSKHVEPLGAIENMAFQHPGYAHAVVNQAWRSEVGSRQLKDS